MNNSESNRSDPVKYIESVFDLAFGTEEEAGKLTPSEVKAALLLFGVDTESGWQSMQATIKAGQGKTRLAAAREERTKTQAVQIEKSGLGSHFQILIDDIQTMLSMSGGEAAIFARKAETMSVEDLESLRNQLIRTAARAAKKTDQ